MTFSLSLTDSQDHHPTSRNSHQYTAVECKLNSPWTPIYCYYIGLHEQSVRWLPPKPLLFSRCELSAGRHSLDISISATCDAAENISTLCQHHTWWKLWTSLSAWPLTFSPLLRMASHASTANISTFCDCQRTFAICYRPSVCLLSVCLSVTFVRPTQAVPIFGNILRH